MKFLTIGLILEGWVATTVGNVLNIIHCSDPFSQGMSVFVIMIFTLLTGVLIPVVACSKNL